MSAGRSVAAMTMAEKMLARAAGLAACKAGDMLQPEPDAVIVHDGYVESLYKELSGLGYRRISRPERMAFVTDHDVIYTTPRVAERGLANRRIAREWRVGHFSDVGQNGHGHLFPMETGMVRPGHVVFAYDPHCTNFGAIGALALGVLGEICVVAATGTLLTQVPGSVRVTLTGAWRPGVHARDLGFALSHALTSGRLAAPYDGRVFEFCGPAVEAMPIASRVGLCNTLTEIGALSVLFPPMTLDGRPVPELASLVGDDDAGYEADVGWDLSALEPQVALPGAPDKAAPLASVADQRIDHAYIGSCGSAMYEDFSEAAAFLRGRSLAPGVRMVVVPGTTRIARRLSDDGVLQVFLDAGASVLPPGCGPCAGGRTGQLAAGEVSISTAATNSAGRMGSPTSLAYLASPLTVAASAVAGRITAPHPTA
ncbi:MULTISPECIES: 3-isopropylmalate dehydratase large subunit [Ramlibacter]|uniref:3-isopropylmalate dehydratase n=1 Tax=Ramlibacter pinisoli TaxID=2682844 RepID=A0A6N8IRJ5_9BURK|nr:MULTISPECIES: aconitase family protein [Ramlibacter]MBA2963526.1 3-isopropylmalate dehydratase [Ramlibacter sp. CGMCC 1.13660]MVQ28493.1 3-isopropylmalate dehydratase [Ramlibacter pinisoli]